ncbi:MAG: cysteine desulfurase family protein [Peptoniphilaceae bacterium]|nr:cysteine desulfurase [Peptoniphilaceae bacterium]MDD7383470.1 cysteine desulfurase family protein [Peptoniphilaceae bacterium]MDY3738468.1 cysteine desulfurase family protein [Peptoniphilaceae bacterium]
MIYLDNAATTKMFKEAIDAQVNVENDFFANPSSLHSFAMKAEDLVEETRKIVSNYMGVNKREIYFTKGATESNNIAIKSFDNSKTIALISKIEHASVDNTFRTSNNFKKKYYVKNDKYGFIDLEDLKSLMREKVNFVSIMHVNNEFGTIQNINEIGKIIKNINPNCIFHVDGTQAFAKIPLNIDDTIDMYSFSGHKIHGPKGIGGIYISDRVKKFIKPILDGGYQEKISSGTTNVSGIYSMGVALKKLLELNPYKNVDKVRNYLLNKLKNIEDIYVISPNKNYSPYILEVAFANIKSEVLLHFLESEEIYVSSGSACSLGNNSRVLSSIYVPEKYIDGSIRFSFSYENTIEEMDKTFEVLNNGVNMIREVMI